MIGAVPYDIEDEQWKHTFTGRVRVLVDADDPSRTICATADPNIIADCQAWETARRERRETA